MAEFPSGFVKQPEILEDQLGQLGSVALRGLKDLGYEVAVGLNEYYAGAISVMARQPHIVEYCPNDSTPKRFASLSSTGKWLEKDGGRATFLLLEGPGPLDNYQLIGYGWTGYDPRARFIDYPITSACRLGDSGLGRGLAADFIQVVVSATHTLYSQEALGLETWLSNRAVSIYKKLGFFALESVENLKEEWRPTLRPDAPNGLTRDKRLHMGYPMEKLVGPPKSSRS